MGVNKGKQSRAGKASVVFVLVFFALLALTGAWWYFVLPVADVEGLRHVTGVIAQSLAAVLGIMVVASIFAFSKVEECKKKMKKAKPKYFSILKNTKGATIVDLRNAMQKAINDSNSVEERTEWLEKLYNVSVLSAVVDGGNEEAAKELKTSLIKSGYSDKYYLDRFEDYILSASVDEIMFFQFIEELVQSSVYKQFDAGKTLVETLSQGFFGEDSIHDYLWTIRGGAETTGPVFKATVTIASITVILSFLVLPALLPGALDLMSGNDVWNAYRILAGAEVTLGAFSFLYIARYIFRVVGGRY